MLKERWRIQMLGGLAARQGEQTVDRFRTRKGGEMLAALALHPNRALTREELLTLLWPEEEPEVGRNRLRVELAALKRQFQDQGQATPSLIEAYRLQMRLNPEAFVTDVVEFEQRLAQAAKATERTEQIALLTQAVDLYRGDLLPAYDTEWIVGERARFAALHQEALRRLIRRLAHERDFDRAIVYAQRAIQVDAWNEEAHLDLIRLLVAVGQPSAAIRQYETLEQTLHDQFAARPTTAAREFVQQVRDRLGHGTRRAEVDLGSQTPIVPLASASPAPDIPAELPVRLTRFFGREQEQAQIAALLKDNRLITLTGPGGNGKTRLMTEIAVTLLPQFSGGVRFVYLGNLFDIAQLPDALRQTLRLPAHAGTTPLDQVIAALSSAPSLLILDNFEHLAEAGASLVQTLLETIPPLTLALTSRRVLGINGEREFPLSPLPTPDLERTPEALATFASVRLFLDRAQAVRPDFQLTPRNAEAIATLCRYLEGIPLAIELAAARIRTMTPAQMSDRLVPRLELLVNPRADKDARHRSLRTAIAWSVRMLSPEAKRFFARLAVFQGGWDAEAAAQVCLAQPWREDAGRELEETGRWSAFDLLERLLSESLLIAEEQNGTMRFRMLETLREFAWEQLPPQEQEQMHRRHASYFAVLAEDAENRLDGPEQSACLRRLEQERANVTAALAWCLETPPTPLYPPIEIGLRISGALWRFWEIRGSVRQARRFVERLLEFAPADTSVATLARAFNTAGTLAQNESDYTNALVFFQKSLDLRRQSGHPEGVGVALSNLGNLHRERKEAAAALQCFEESLAIARDLAIPRRIAATLNNMAVLYAGQGEFDAAQTAFREALILRKQIGDRRTIFSTLANLAALAHHQGDLLTALHDQKEALAMARELEDRFAIGVSLINIGSTYLALEDSAAALPCLQEGLQMHTAFGSRFGQAFALEGLASHAAQTDDLARAGALLGAAQALRLAIDAILSSVEQRQVDGAFAHMNTDPEFLRALETGRNLPIEAAISLALQSP